MFFQFQLFLSVDLEYYTKMSKRKRSPTTTNNDLLEAEGPRYRLKLSNETGRNILKRIENLEAYSFSSETHDEILELKQKVEDLLTQYNQLLSLPDELAKQQVEIEQLRKENEELTAKVERLETKIQNLELGQVMTVFERNLAQFVLHPIKEVGEYADIKYMLECLGKKGEKMDKSAGRNELDERWNKFQSSNSITWTKAHKNAIVEIRRNRNEEAHSTNFDLDRVIQQITKLYVHRETECLEIIGMLKKLNHLLVLGVFSCEFKKTVVSFILPGKDGTTLSQLMKWLIKNKSTEEGRAANQRWDDLAQGKTWTKNHKRALQEMAKLKRDKTTLYEIVDFEESKLHVVDYVKPELKNQCFEIIDMMKIFPTLSGEQWKLPDKQLK